MGKILFKKEKHKYGCFSNFSRHAVTIDGQRFPTTEHYFQAMKFHHCPEYFPLIRDALSPGDAKKLGSSRAHPLRSDWESVKEDVMRKALRAKFMQHTQPRETLLSTGSDKLVEDTSHDYYWGNGRDKTGMNRLGMLLMELREQLRLENGADCASHDTTEAVDPIMALLSQPQPQTQNRPTHASTLSSMSTHTLYQRLTTHSHDTARCKRLMNDGAAVVHSSEAWLRFFSSKGKFRVARRLICRQTMHICRKSTYTTECGNTVRLDAAAVDAAKRGTKVYTNVPAVKSSSSSSARCLVDVVNMDCIEAAEQLDDTRDGSVAILNMACTTHPGGGWLGGSGAQEENVFRRSAYHMALSDDRKSSLYPIPAKGGIYTPSVLVFRSSEATGYRMLTEPRRFAFIAVAAIRRPRLVTRSSGGKWLSPRDEALTMHKVRAILRMASLHGHRRVVLSALGCGAYGNPPHHVSLLFRRVLEEAEFVGVFDHVRFAIIDDHNARGVGNFAPFRDVFSTPLTTATAIDTTTSAPEEEKETDSMDVDMETDQSTRCIVANIRDVFDKRTGEWRRKQKSFFSPPSSSESFVYVGRTVKGWGVSESPFHNPFRMNDKSRPERERCYRAFSDYFHRPDQVQLRRRALKELPGKTLVCWCAPLRCHSEVLARFVNTQQAQEHREEGMLVKRSCGVVVYRGEGQARHFLLLRHKGGRGYDLPKGHMEHQESVQDTAFRELREETGLQREQLDLHDAFIYMQTYYPQYKRLGGETVKKMVTFLLCRVRGDTEPVVKVSEHVGFEWLHFSRHSSAGHASGVLAAALQHLDGVGVK